MRRMWVLLVVLALAGCRPDNAAPAVEGAMPPGETAQGASGPRAPVLAAHYFGKHWPKNFIAAFRHDEVARDFAALRADGFNTVILLVSWGDFQPVFDPCCRYDERSFQRLHFLLDQARAAGLQVMLRVGYAWTYHPDAGDAGQRMHRLLNDEAARTSFLAYLERLDTEIGRHPHVVMSFMTWEDQWLRSIDESARATFADYTAMLPANLRPPAGAPMPRFDDAGSALFHAYWDWLVTQRLLAQAQAKLANLSYEARIDKEPQFTVDADGSRRIAGWLDHHAMLRQPGTAPVTIYWAPFWGAQNQGEVLAAGDSLELLENLLEETRGVIGERALFIDQFNFVDNTPGHELNASLDPEQVDDFLSEAVCTLKDHGVIGVGLWTVRDYHESPLYNPAFGYGLDGWSLVRASGEAAEAAVVALPSGDNELRFGAGDTLRQALTPRLGRLPREDTRPDWICIEASAEVESGLLVQAGDGEPVTLRFPVGGVSRQCAAIIARPRDDRLVLHIEAAPAASLRLRDVWLYDHIQYGGLYDDSGRPGRHLEAVRRFNADFTQHAPAQCAR